MQSINLNQNDIYKYQYYHGFDEKGKEKSFVYFINSPYEELFINVVFHFTIDSNNEEFFYSYNAEEIKEKEIALTDQIQNKYFSIESSVHSTHSYKLTPSSEDEIYFIIELALKYPLNSSSLNFSVEEFTTPTIRTYKNSSNIEISDINHINGKNQIILRYNNTKALPLIFSLYDDENDINALFNYYTVKSLNEIPQYDFNDTITAEKKKKQSLLHSVKYH